MSLLLLPAVAAAAEVFSWFQFSVVLFVDLMFHVFFVRACAHVCMCVCARDMLLVVARPPPFLP